MNGSRDRRRKADPKTVNDGYPALPETKAQQKARDKAGLAVVRSETDWRPLATHANAKNIVRECYFHDVGAEPHCGPFTERHYLDWCEAKAVKWIGLAESFGYTGWTGEIRTLTGQITYHEWLKKDVGL